MEGKAAAERILEILETPVPARRGAKTPEPLSGGLTIEFAGVGYAYPVNEDQALSDLTLTLPAGTRTVLVGCSGSGKSMLVNLLLRFLEP